MKGLLDVGKTALHIKSNMATPDTVAIRIATPSIKASPMASSPIMNSQSAQRGASEALVEARERALAVRQEALRRGSAVDPRLGPE